MIFIGILKQEKTHLWRILRGTNLDVLRTLHDQRSLEYRKCLLNPQLPVMIHQPYRTRKLKFSFGYTNYAHRKHVRPPGHHVSQYFQFFFIIMGAYALFYITFVRKDDLRFVKYWFVFQKC